MRRLVFVALSIISSFLLTGAAHAMTGTGSTSLNSNTHSATYGNEAHFFRVKNSNSPNPGFTNGTIDINSDAVLMQAYISNDGSAAAQNVNINITLPTGFATSQMATATMSADNASSVTDSVAMADSQPFGLAFDQGAQVYIGKRSGTGNNDYVNTATSDYRINGNVMTIHLGNWEGGYNQEGTITVRVNVLRNAPAPTPTPAPTAFACTSLQRSAIDNNRSTLTASANGTAAGANISSYNFLVKNSSGQIVDNYTVNTTAQSAVYNFNQTQSGVYTIVASSTSDKGTTAASSTCSQSITVPAVLATTTATTTATTPTANTKALPNTGAGDVLGIFSGASVLGGAGHYISRRFRR